MPNDYWPLTPPDDWEDTGVPYWFQQMVWNIYSSLPGAEDFGFTEQTFYNQFQNYFPEYNTAESDLLEEMMLSEISNMSDNIELWHANQVAQIDMDEAARQLQLDMADEQMLLGMEGQDLNQKFSNNQIVQQALSAIADMVQSVGGNISSGAMEGAKNALLADLQSAVISGGKNALFDKQTALIKQKQAEQEFAMASGLINLNLEADISAKDIEFTNMQANEGYQLAYDQWNIFDQWEANLYDRIAKLYALGSEQILPDIEDPDSTGDVITGCMDPNACDYNPSATQVGDCQYPEVPGDMMTCVGYSCEQQGQFTCPDGICADTEEDCAINFTCEEGFSEDPDNPGECIEDDLGAIEDDCPDGQYFDELEGPNGACVCDGGGVPDVNGDCVSAEDCPSGQHAEDGACVCDEGVLDDNGDCVSEEELPDCSTEDCTDPECEGEDCEHSEEECYNLLGYQVDCDDPLICLEEDGYCAEGEYDETGDLYCYNPETGEASPDYCDEEWCVGSDCNLNLGDGCTDINGDPVECTDPECEGEGCEYGEGECAEADKCNDEEACNTGFCEECWYAEENEYCDGSPIYGEGECSDEDKCNDEEACNTGACEECTFPAFGENCEGENILLDCWTLWGTQDDEYCTEEGCTGTDCDNYVPEGTCEDEAACNTGALEECIYAEEGFDCEGEPVYEEGECADEDKCADEEACNTGTCEECTYPEEGFDCEGEPVYGEGECADEDKCNDADACNNGECGECIYAEEGYDCEGNSTNPIFTCEFYGWVTCDDGECIDPAVEDCDGNPVNEECEGNDGEQLTDANCHEGQHLNTETCLCEDDEYSGVCDEDEATCINEFQESICCPADQPDCCNDPDYEEEDQVGNCDDGEIPCSDGYCYTDGEEPYDCFDDIDLDDCDEGYSPNADGVCVPDDTTEATCEEQGLYDCGMGYCVEDPEECEDVAYDCDPEVEDCDLGEVEVCDDDSACNTGAEGDCEYAMTNYDCDGNAVEGWDYDFWTPPSTPDNWNQSYCWNGGMHECDCFYLQSTGNHNPSGCGEDLCLGSDCLNEQGLTGGEWFCEEGDLDEDGLCTPDNSGDTGEVWVPGCDPADEDCDVDDTGDDTGDDGDDETCTEPGACNEGGLGDCIFPEEGFGCDGMPIDENNDGIMDLNQTCEELGLGIQCSNGDCVDFAEDCEDEEGFCPEGQETCPGQPDNACFPIGECPDTDEDDCSDQDGNAGGCGNTDCVGLDCNPDCGSDCYGWCDGTMVCVDCANGNPFMGPCHNPDPGEVCYDGDGVQIPCDSGDDEGGEGSCEEAGMQVCPGYSECQPYGDCPDPQEGDLHVWDNPDNNTDVTNWTEDDWDYYDEMGECPCGGSWPYGCLGCPDDDGGGDLPPCEDSGLCGNPGNCYPCPDDDDWDDDDDYSEYPCEVDCTCPEVFCPNEDGGYYKSPCDGSPCEDYDPEEEPPS